MHFMQSERSALFFFQVLGENTCSMQPALKNTAPAFKAHLLN